ncbi:carbon starvation protein A, partial [Sutterella wadsworthensis]
QKVLNINAARETPANRFEDGKDYVPTNKYVLFGHHFAAIAAAGPLLGPVLAAQFGYLPGLLWILIGCVLAGGVHDMVVLFCSVRHRGKSLAYIASQEIDTTTGRVAAWAVLAILLLTLAGLSIAVVNAMHNSLWSTYTVFCTIPIAVLMGLYMQVWRKGDVRGATIMGVVLLFLCILSGPWVASHPEYFGWLDIDKPEMSLIIPAYGFLASVLPVWLLLLPRDYLSTFLKIGTIGALAIGIAFVMPTFHMPAITEFIHGGGPIIGGPVIPFLFITIACGALSGFHATIGTGTTPKMINNEKDVLFVGYGAMLMEGFVAVMALVAACVLVPADYFAINAPAEKFAKLGMDVVELPTLEAEVQENLMHRPGGSVSLAVGMAHIFSKIPAMESLMAYWYHFAIMFEAVFILTAVDAGTRVGRFFLQEMVGKVWPRFADKDWWPGIIITSAVFTGAWGYLVYSGDIGSIWPLFGICNQLLASVTLLIGTTVIIRMNHVKYAWTTGAPGILMTFITFWAGIWLIINQYLPSGQYLLAFLSALVMCLMLFVIVGVLRRWMVLLNIHTTVKDKYGVEVKTIVEE